MAKSGKSRFAILGMLALLKKSTGYDLKKHMEASTHYFWKESFGSIYPILEDLEKQQLIVKVDEPSRNDRQRNTYKLTSKGREALEHWLVQTPEPLHNRNELLLKLFFGGLSPVEVSTEHLENYQKELEVKLSTYQKIKRELSKDNSLESSYYLITLDHGIRLTKASREWCANAIKTLKAIDIEGE